MTETRVQVEPFRVIDQGCALLDRSERGKLALTGSGAKAFLGGQVSNDTEALTAGHGLYAALLTPKGKMLADLRGLDLGPPTHELLLPTRQLWLDTERAGLQPLFDALRRGIIGHDAELHKRTLQQSLLSLLGPRA